MSVFATVRIRASGKGAVGALARASWSFMVSMVWPGFGRSEKGMPLLHSQRNLNVNESRSTSLRSFGLPIGLFARAYKPIGTVQLWPTRFPRH